MPVRNRIADRQDEVTGRRRDFHQHPKLMFDTHRGLNCRKTAVLWL